MSDNDKNLHLSPVLEKIRDYGPGEVPAEESEVTPEELLAEMSTEAAPDPAPEPEPASADTVAEEVAEEAAEQPPPAPPPAAAPAPAKSSKLAVYSLIFLWLLTLAGGFGAFVWQQIRIDALALELRDERGKGRDLVAAAEREATRLADRVVELDDTIVALRMALADAQSEAATLAIASLDAAPSEQPAPELIEEAPAPEPVPEAEQPAVAPIAVAPTAAAPIAAAPIAAAEPATAAAPEPAAPAQQATEAVAADSPTGPWYINLSTLSSQAAAEQWLKERPGAPERTEIIPVQSGGKTLYRVRVGGYASREEALGLAERLGASSAWASKG